MNFQSINVNGTDKASKNINAAKEWFRILKSKNTPTIRIVKEPLQNSNFGVIASAAKQSSYCKSDS